MLFAATWMQPEIVILSEASQRKKYHMTSLYMWNHSQTLENKLMAAGGRDSQGVWDRHVHIAVFKTDNQQGPTIQHMELCPIFYGSL